MMYVRQSAARLRKETEMRWREITAVAAALTASGLMLSAPAQADPSTTDEVCGAFNLGVPQSEIPGRLGANDGRENYWRAQRETNWPIIEGECG